MHILVPWQHCDFVNKSSYREVSRKGLGMTRPKLVSISVMTADDIHTLNTKLNSTLLKAGSFYCSFR